MITPYIYSNYWALLFSNSAFTSANVLLFKLYTNLRHNVPNINPTKGITVINVLILLATSGVWVAAPDWYPIAASANPPILPTIAW